jgi:ATP-dependent helicase/nuclease subunit A
MPSLSHEQREASDPAASVFVSANAGAGKTSVLASRVLRLMLAGANPSRILCLTFTKAAAANMQNRVFDQLGRWVSLDDAELGAAIADLEGRPATAIEIAQARKLFARAIETPGGLKIQTIHAFCEKLLHQFPFEAGVPARFEMLDDVSGREAMRQAVNGAIRAALTEPHTPIGQALALAGSEAGEERLREALAGFIQLRRGLEAPALERKFAVSPLRAALGVKPGERVADVEAGILNQGLYGIDWREIASWLEGGGKRDKHMAAALKAGHGVQGEQNLTRYLMVFLTKALTPRSDKGFFVSKALREARPELFAIMDDERARVHEQIGRRKAIAAAARTEAITLLADAALARYRAEKRRRGALDFDDLIRKAARLLGADTAAWVRYKLDHGLDHVLVDEAQDTSPLQWSIVRALTDDFFSGEGARGGGRTIFAVGDEKQSIFGFQGARPEEFETARHHFGRTIDALNTDAPRPHAFRKVELRTSYRTVPDVLEFVDGVFSIPENFGGLDSANQRTVHFSSRLGKPGLVELWPPETTEKQEKVDPTLPVDATPPDSAPARLGRRIARRVAHWIRTDARFDDDGKPITPGDVLVLVRNRGAIFDSVLKALKQEGVPVAGADRMKLSEQIAVMDLLALGRVVLLPEDDLSLAALLRSPLFDLAEENLLTLANGRGDLSLWAALGASAEPGLAPMRGRLERWRALSRKLDPFAFYAHVLSADGARRELTARLGPEADEAMGVFMAQLRAWQSRNPPSLLAFVEEMLTLETDVKRDMEEAHGRVRVMTVHASKGLEARIVFMADSYSRAVGGTKTDMIVHLDAADPTTAVWTPRKKDDPPEVEAARAAMDALALAEHRRLLYVGLTRARDRLYIAGCTGLQNPPEESWRLLIDAALGDDGRLREAEDEEGHGRVLRFRVTPVVPVARAERPVPEAAPAIPDWLWRQAPAEPRRPPPLRPSRLSDAAEPPEFREGAAGERGEARQRGDLIHHLLEHLPQASPDRREVAGARLAAARAPDMADDARREAVRRALAIMDEPSLAALFGPGSRAEVAIAGKLRIGGELMEVSGRIDRMAVTPAAVMLVDFKTGRPPTDPRQVPDAHLRQLAVYRALLADLYPDREVVAAVVWTQSGRITQLDAARLDTALDASAWPKSSASIGS